jgi:hypothetical protein
MSNPCRINACGGFSESKSGLWRPTITYPSNSAYIVVAGHKTPEYADLSENKQRISPINGGLLA